MLAGEVGKNNGDLAAGLQAYEERMKPIIADMQKIPPGVPTVLAPQTIWGIRVRNVIVTIIAWAMASSWIWGWAGKLFASAFGGDKYGLPDYEWVD